MKTTLLKLTILLIIHSGCRITGKQTRRRYQLMHHLIYVGCQVLLYIPTSILNDASIVKKVALCKSEFTGEYLNMIYFENNHIHSFQQRTQGFQHESRYCDLRVHISNCLDTMGIKC